MSSPITNFDSTKPVIILKKKLFNEIADNAFSK
jgi:hypothetical protein